MGSGEKVASLKFVLKRESIAKQSSEFKIGNQKVLDIAPILAFTHSQKYFFDYPRFLFIWMTGADHYTG